MEPAITTRWPPLPALWWAPSSPCHRVTLPPVVASFPPSLAITLWSPVPLLVVLLLPVLLVAVAILVHRGSSPVMSRVVVMVALRPQSFLSFAQGGAVVPVVARWEVWVDPCDLISSMSYCPCSQEC